MKNQYVGDANDYVKYAFLRRLLHTGSAVTVCWMLTADDDRSDGSRRGYLSKPKHFRHHDPELFDALAGPLGSARNIRAIERADILPRTQFVSDTIDDSQELRQRYFGHLHAELAPASLIFFDPDNGLDVATVSPGRRNSSKYLYRQELRAVLDDGHSAIVYQHFPRVSRERFVGGVFGTVEPPRPDMRYACVYTAHVAYLLFLQRTHSAALDTARGFATDWHPAVKYLERAVPTPSQG